MENMPRPIRFALTAGLLSMAAGCASELPGLAETDGGYLTVSGSGGGAPFGAAGAPMDPAPNGPAGGEFGGASAANGGSSALSGSGGASPYGGSTGYGSGGTTSGGGGALGSGGSCVPGTLFCPAVATGGAGGGQSGGGGTGGGALKCDNAICWDVFDCAIFHADLLACNFTKCEGFVCKP
jgi:hypothetical protein